MTKKYTISIPVQVDYKGNKMSPQTTTIDIEVNAESADDAVWRAGQALEKLVNDHFVGH